MFQFTLPRGERRRRRAQAPGSRSFNSRSRGGSDTYWTTHHDNRLVSIHAPAGGATRCPTARKTETKSFNSRSRGGSDTTSIALIQLLDLFQFTLPRGERLRSTFKAHVANGFNSRSRGGSD